MAKYKIWDKQEDVYTPSGKVYTAQEWMEKYGWLSAPSAVPVVAGGLINGAFAGELSEMKALYEKMGADFSACATNEDCLAVIEACEDSMNAPNTDPTPEERIAAALEFQNLLAL